MTFFEARKIRDCISAYRSVALSFLGGGLLVAGIGFAMQGRAFGFEHVSVATISPAFVVGAVCAAIICALVVRNRALLLERLDLERAISSRLEAENAESEARYRTIIETMIEIYYETDTAGRVSFVSPSMTAMLGYAEDEFVGVEMASIYAEPGARSAFLQALDDGGGIVRDYLVELRKKDGTTLWVSTNARYRYDCSGALLGVAGTVRDATERRAYENLLWQREAFLRSLTDNLPVSIAYFDAEQKYRFVNRTTEIWYAQPGSEMLGRGRDSVVRTTTHDADAIAKVMSGRTVRSEYHVAFPDGVTRWVDLTRIPDFDERHNVRGFFRLAIDISERKEAEQKLRDSEERLRLIAENFPAAITYFDADHRYRYVNRTSERWNGRSADEIIGRTAAEVRGGVLSDVARESTARALAGEFQHYERPVHFGDGQTRFCDITYVPDRAEDGTPRGYYVFVTDITERKAAEDALRRSEEQLRQSQKMEAIGKLTGGMAHDFNNYLGVIIGNLDLLEDHAAADPVAVALIEAAMRGALRSADLTRSLLAFSRKQPLVPKRIDVRRNIEAMAALLNRMLGDDIVLTTEFAPDLWPVRIDESQLDSCIVNLATNGRDAMPRGGALAIAVRNVELDELCLAASDADFVPGQYVSIEVSDTGTGMSPETLAQVFEPFFSTKGVGHGTGLGLSMVHGFVKQSGGQIDIYSELGRGTAVRMYLPRDIPAGAESEAEAGASVRAVLPRGSETILVVDDNESMRLAMAAQLRSLGYIAVEAEDGPAALAILNDGTRPIDMLLSDVVMPGGMDGYDLGARARQIRPGLKVLLTSGFPDRMERTDAAGAAAFTLLRKPYRRDVLARAIRAELD